MSSNYRLPPVNKTLDGRQRAAGFEFEFGNLPIARASEALQSALGGELEAISPFEAVIHGTRIGRLKVERDANLLKSVRYRQLLESIGLEFKPGSIGHDIETNIDNASRGLIPCEVVTDPIPFAELERLDELVAALHELGAEGTQNSLIYAFGLHINPSLPAGDSLTIVRYIQAYLLLHAWLVQLSDTDKTRRFLTRYIDPFPHGYLERVLVPDYRPESDQLIDDYLHHNPTRNRALDMLPILANLDADRVYAGLEEGEQRLVKARPAFHYRLPDCRINEPGWSVADAWNRWVFVEQLASDEALLGELIDLWRKQDRELQLTPGGRWVQLLTSVLAQRALTR